MEENTPNQQQPYGQPNNQQPYQQPNGQPNGQQPYQPQQPYQQPAANSARPATQGEVDGLFSVAGGAMMLVLSIIASVNLAVSLFSNFPLSIISNVLPILTLIGLWICYSNAKKKKLNKTGPTLIRVPFIISFIVSVLIYAVVILVCLLAIRMAGEIKDSSGVGMSVTSILAIVLVFVVAAFVVNILYFRSINNCLKNSSLLNQGIGISKPSGTLAAVMMIIKAVISFIPGFAIALVSLGGGAIFDQIFGGMDISALDSIIGMLKGFGVMTIISSFITLAYNILAAILILQFCKKTAQGVSVQ
ncbi:MAG: hypothetical protein K2F90_02185 [Clostridiales bacterium]|nr:hypothetical protein [Clostridiales bacterium]